MDLEAQIIDLCHAIRTGLQTLDFAGRGKMIELLIDRVLLSHEEVEIRYASPLTGARAVNKKEMLRLPYRAHAELEEPLPTRADPLGQESV